MRWTKDQFGEAQARGYAQTLSSALEALADGGPTTIDAKARNEIVKGLVTLHVARRSRKGRHILLFRVGQDDARRFFEINRLGFVLQPNLHFSRAMPGAACSLSRGRACFESQYPCCSQADV